ncbi:hypothetical protein ACET3Z_028193 [Daucus carota]
MLRTSKQERDALFAARSKLADVLSFLRAKGFTEEQIFDEQLKDGFGYKPPIRDDFGLPVFNGTSVTASPNPFVDKMKGKVDEHQVIGEDPKLKNDTSHKVFDELPKTVTPGDEETTKSWANVLKKETVPPVNFKFYPPGEGCKSLGHTVGACPNVTRIWVQKEKGEEAIVEPKTNEADAKPDRPVQELSQVAQESTKSADASSVGNLNEESNEWTEIKRKKTPRPISETEASPSPPRTFMNLRNVDEVEKNAKLTRSQKKRLRRLKGSSSPHPQG